MTGKKGKKGNKALAIVPVEDRQAPPERMSNVKDVLAPVFNQAQMNLLLNRTPDYAKQKRPGPGGKSLTYVKHGYVTDQLNKAFGFDWDLLIDPIEGNKMYTLQVETYTDGKTEKTTRHLSVCGRLVVRVHNKAGSVVTQITKSGFGSQIWNSGMELGDALKAAKSDLLKVCAAQLGVALDLYWSDLDEQNKFEDEQERRRVIEEQEAITVLAEDITDKRPANAVALIARASADFKMTLEQIDMTLGPGWMNRYNPDMWDTLQAEHDKKAGA